MRQILIVLSFILVMVSCVPTKTTMSVIKVPKNVKIPTQAKFLSQSCDMDNLYQSMVDLSNNELIILEYSFGRLHYVYRTGITINPDEHIVSYGTDAPFSEPEEIEIDAIDKEDDSDDDNNEDNWLTLQSKKE